MAVRGRGRASLSYLFVDEAVEHAHQETLSEEERNQLAAVDSLFAAQSTAAVNGLVLGTEGNCLLAPSSLMLPRPPKTECPECRKQFPASHFCGKQSSHSVPPFPRLEK